MAYDNQYWTEIVSMAWDIPRPIRLDSISNRKAALKSSQVIILWVIAQEDFSTFNCHESFKESTSVVSVVKYFILFSFVSDDAKMHHLFPENFN
jgi:hypothetical protein